MKAPYLATLDDLAAKRRELTAVIVALAGIQGVDPAPYLDLAAPAVADDGRPRAPKPPRPQAPASPTTNGTGLEDKVLHVIRSGPIAPKAIVEKTGLRRDQVFDLLPQLRAAGKVKRTGNGRSVCYQLP